MDLLEKMNKTDLKELFSKNWLTHDAMRYGNCVFDQGPEIANRLNKKSRKVDGGNRNQANHETDRHPESDDHYPF